MRIEAPLGTLCVTGTPTLWRVDDVDNASLVVWTTIKAPAGDATFTYMGDDFWEMTVPVSGVYIVEAEYCGV